MFISVVFIVGIIGVVFIGAAITGSVLKVLANQFEELMPDRMVDMAGFVELPPKN